jgi:DNA-binding response OmpR family regulator
MVIEDDAEVAALLAGFAEEHGYATILIPRAQDALDYLRQDHPDGILLDLMLSGMSRLQFLDTLSRQGLGIPVVVVSGVGEEEAAAVTLRLGALDFIAKPFTFEHLRLPLGALELTSVKQRLQEIDLIRDLAFQH